MLSYLSKLLPLFFYPVGCASVLAVAAAVFILLQKKKTSLVLAFLSAALLWIFSSPVVAHLLVRGLESKYDPPPDFPQASAIVVLGGCTQPAVAPRRYIETNCSGDRISHAARLFRGHYAPIMICTGGKIPFVYDFNGTEGANMAAILRELWSFDSSAIIVEDKAQNTHDHAPLVQEILLRRGLKKDVIIVTSAMHMYRSVKVFKKFGYTVRPAPTDYWEDKQFQWNLFLLFPRAECLFASTVALHEYYGILAYKLLGWI
jgi:uncharacterized SAM-binding protein YcdF (DUF218 family)